MRRLLIALTLLSLSLPPANAVALTDVEALTQLNAWRAEVGIPGPVALDPAMSEGCALHSQYMALNQMLTHSEQEGRPGYSAAGADAAASSVIAYGLGGGPREVWGQAVYHRLQLLNPRLARSGYGSSAGYSCMGVFGVDLDASTPQLSVYPYPYDGQRDVPLRFVANEIPDPAADAGGDRDLGYLISANVNGPWLSAPQTTLTSVSLTAADGSSVPVVGVDHRSPNGRSLDGGFGIFPTEPLRPDTTYTARAVGTVTASSVGTANASAGPMHFAFDRSWSFSTTSATAPPAPPAPGSEPTPTPVRPVQISIANARRIELEGSPRIVTVTVSRGARVIASNTMDVPDSWRPRIRRQARYRICVTAKATAEQTALSTCLRATLASRPRPR